MPRLRALFGIILVTSLAAASPACDGEDETSSGGSTASTTTTTSTTVEMPPPLGPLPAGEAVESDRFATSGHCNQCHLAADAPVMHDAAGEDISPAFLWRSSMMAFAARDPYYLAVFSEELAARPGIAEEVERTCTRCHAPAGSVEHEQTGGHLTFAALTAEATPEANLGRDGVTCSLCHQIKGVGLGSPGSFGGSFEVGFSREMFGPHQQPNPEPMEFFLGYTPTYAEHVATSELCATCHTVVVPVLDAAGAPAGGEFLEQAPYLEWLNSDYRGDAPCQACHMPQVDADGSVISSPISKFPEGLSPREPFGKHVFVGGNAYMLGMLADADNLAWAGSDVSAGELAAAAARSEEHLRDGVDVSIASAAPDGDALRVVVEVKNAAGHKYPTGYPSRRAWIHFRAEDAAGKVVLESGAFDASGAIVDAAGKRLDLPGVVAPHLDEVSSSEEVQIYEAIAGDLSGAPTHRALGAASFLKDNRLLPAGWSSGHEWIDWIAPVGVEGDASFGAAGDQVTYRIAGGSAVRRVVVELLYQSVPPATLDMVAAVPTPAAVRFSEMARERPPTPVVVASTSLDL